MVYKIINDKVILESEMLPKFSAKQPIRPCNEAKVGFKNQLAVPPNRIDITGHTFFYNAPRVWNNTISENQANAPSIDAFKNHFKKKTS